MRKGIKRLLQYFIIFVFVAGVASSIYLKYFADFPIEKKRLFRIIRQFPRLYMDNHGRQVAFYSNGLKIKGTLYEVDHEGTQPCIILLHGSSPYGRKLALYRILGRKFAEQGYITLAFDFRGFGESDDPKVGHTNMFDFCQDVSDAISFVKSIQNVDSSRIFVVGHSLGGSVAFVLGTRDERIQKVVSIGPSRRLKEGFLAGLTQKIDNGINYIAANEFRLSREMKLVGNIPLGLVKESVLRILIDDYVDYYARANHKPLLLIDGELENSADKIFLRELYHKLRPPSDYATFGNVAHYHNTINWDGGTLLFYDSKAVVELVGYIDNWLSN